MNWEKLRRWVPLLLMVLACNGKLRVDEVSPSGGNDSAEGGRQLVDADSSGHEDAAPGRPGPRCIPGGASMEAQGSVAQTEVVTLDRCDEGLTCGPDGRCTPVPVCPAGSGVCVVRHASLGAGGAGGAGGSLNAGGGTSGAYGSPPVAVAESGVLAMAADDSHLYWVEYGTRDSLGNYQNDGALMSWAFDSGVTTTLASRLPGPADLGITDSHAYVYVDGAPLVGITIHPQLLRVSLSGGAPELVQDGVVPRSFAAAAGDAFWSTDTVIYSMSASAGAVPRIFVNSVGSGLAADATNLYYASYEQNGTNATIWRHPLDGSSPQPVLSPAYPFGLRGSVIDGIESVNNETGILLDEGSIGGGSWQRVRALGAGGIASKFQIAGDRFYLDSHPPEVGPSIQPDFGKIGVLTGSFAASGPPIRLFERAARQTFVDHLWVGTARTFYWSDGRAIYARMLDGLP